MRGKMSVMMVILVNFLMIKQDDVPVFLFKLGSIFPPIFERKVKLPFSPLQSKHKQYPHKIAGK